MPGFGEWRGELVACLGHAPLPTIGFLYHTLPIALISVVNP
jgi:hypothetical protein